MTANEWENYVQPTEDECKNLSKTLVISLFTLAKNVVRRFRSTINVTTSFCVQEKDGNRLPYLEPMKAGLTVPTEQVILIVFTFSIDFSFEKVPMSSEVDLRDPRLKAIVKSAVSFLPI